MSTPGQYTLVFHLSYPAPMDVATSAAYSAYIYDTQAAGSTASSSALTKWFNTRTTPVPAPTRCRPGTRARSSR